MSTGPVLSFNGVGSGIDTGAMVKALMDAERIPMTKIQDSIKSVNSQRGVVQEINNLLSNLRSKAADLYAPQAFEAKQATAADSAILTASANAGAANGTFNINVTQLAQAHTMASTAGSTLTAGTSLEITVGGETRNVAVEEGDTLQSFAQRINGAGTGVSASVVNDRLVFISRTGGSDGQISVGGSASDALGMTTTQAGQNAEAMINGIAVSSSSNSFEGQVNGLSFTAKAVGATTVTVASNTEASAEKVQAFVDAYNSLVRNIGNATRYDPATKTAGTLQGDALIRGIQSSLRNIVGNVVQGLGEGQNSLFNIGIDTTRDGTLTFDKAKFADAVNKDPNVVANVFGAGSGVTSGNPADGIARQIAAFADEYGKGPMSERLSGYGRRVAEMNDRIARMETNLDMREQRLRAQFSAMDSAIARMQAQQQQFMARLGG